MMGGEKGMYVCRLEICKYCVIFFKKKKQKTKIP